MPNWRGDVNRPAHPTAQNAHFKSVVSIARYAAFASMKPRVPFKMRFESRVHVTV